ncbi:uncharacterized protein TNCV_3334391 [Trichonephila clavipes]|nr:uncharacterized protein TNCV_3334391 [Trichonephila clavipes]
MPLHCYRRQYEQLSQFGRGIIIGMMEVGRPARRVARQLGHSDCVVRKCWDQWILEISFTLRPGSRSCPQTTRRGDRHIVRNSSVQPTALLTTIQAHVVPSLEALCLLEPYEDAWLNDIWYRSAHCVSCP